MKNIDNYQRVHQWLAYHYGRAYKCEHCNGTKKSKRNEWALKKGFKYEKNVDNFIQLCSSCHKLYDFTEETRKKQSLAKIGLEPNNKGVDNRPIKTCIICKGEYKTYHKKSTICSLDCRNKNNSLSKGKKIKEIKHGTISGYNYHKCKCDLCRDKNTEYCKSRRNKLINKQLN